MLSVLLENLSHCNQINEPRVIINVQKMFRHNKPKYLDTLRFLVDLHIFLPIYSREKLFRLPVCLAD